MRPSNYDLQAQAAGRSFAAQDLDAIAARFALRRDETYLYLELLHEPLRLSRADQPQLQNSIRPCDLTYQNLQK